MIPQAIRPPTVPQQGVLDRHRPQTSAYTSASALQRLVSEMMRCYNGRYVWYANEQLTLASSGGLTSTSAR